MRIGIDARMYRESGIGRYLKNLLWQLQTLDKQNSYFIFLGSKDYETLMMSNNFTKVEAPFLFYGIEEQLKMPGLLNKYSLDLVHFPHFNLPVAYYGPFVVTIHDLIHQHFSWPQASTHPALIYWLKKQGYKKAFTKAVNSSVHILTPSDFVKAQLINEWQTNDGKITVTHEAVDPDLFTLAAKTQVDEFDELKVQFRIKGRYIFYVGNVHPHKNITLLIQAFKNIRPNYPHLQLVLAGAENDFWLRLAEQIKDEANIIITGFMPDPELAALYKNAACFVFPSLEEGFGIPLLEAMVFKCALVCSDIPVFREVAGNAATYFDPKSVEDLALKLKLVLEDQNLRNERIALGRQQVKQFSWKKLAEATLKVYMTAL